MKKETYLDMIKDWVNRKIANMISETSRRYVLYDLAERARKEYLEINPSQYDIIDWDSFSFKELYETLKD